MLPKNEPREFDESKLMCSAHGCPNRWSVNMGKPLCSAHAWADPEHWGAITARILGRRHLGEEHGIASYYEPNDEF